jgi:hypothetical protein
MALIWQAINAILEQKTEMFTVLCPQARRTKLGMSEVSLIEKRLWGDWLFPLRRD